MAQWRKQTENLSLFASLRLGVFAFPPSEGPVTATSAITLPQGARGMLCQQRAQEHARYEAEKRKAAEREKAERAAQREAFEAQDRERRMKRAGAI